LMVVMPVFAQDDEEENGGGGGKLDANLQLKLCDNAWNKRQFDDFASQAINFCVANPDHASTPDVWWRAYLVYRDYRPNEPKRKSTYEKAMAAYDKYEKKYADSKKDYASVALWYKGHMSSREIGSQVGVNYMLELLRKYPGVPLEREAQYQAGNWLREQKRNREAIEQYDAAEKSWGVSPQGANIVVWRGWCYQELKDNESAIQSYKILLDKPFNIGWGEVHWNLLDIARRMKAIGEDELSRKFAMKIIDKGDPNWDVTKQASAMLFGAAKSVNVFPHYNLRYSADGQNLDGNTKCKITKEMPVLLRIYGYPKDAPFKGTLSMFPLVDMVQTTGTKTENDKNEATYSADIQVPNKNGDYGDLWYTFKTAEAVTSPPGGLIITRKWEKTGEDWGMCTITVKCPFRVHIFITTNNKLNANNFNDQPNEIRDGDKTARWYDWVDLTNGRTLTFPVNDVKTAEYYPRVQIYYGSGNWVYKAENTKGKDCIANMKEMKVTLSSETDFSAHIEYPSDTWLTLNEFTK
ncbi:MAG: tetratricopeptide repeat protein, partial [bacterium]